MSEFFDYDPLTGVTQFIDHDPENPYKMSIHTVQDIEPVLEQAKMSRNNQLRDNGIKESWWHYASIPLAVCMQLRKKGLEIFDPKVDAKRVNQEINTHYPALKMTDKQHDGTVKQFYIPK